MDRDIANGRVIIQAVDADVELRFSNVLEKCFTQSPPVLIRTNDALHIASAIAAGEAEFVTADVRQRAAAQLMGLTVNP
jgi:predicted nucleic acid-binding protein